MLADKEASIDVQEMKMKRTYQKPVTEMMQIYGSSHLLEGSMMLPENGDEYVEHETEVMSKGLEIDWNDDETGE